MDIKEYRFEDILIGMTASFKRIITKEDMLMFKKISGDENPLHSDEFFAKEKGFEKPVVYGFLTASLLSKLAGVHMPGKNSLILSSEIQFVKPILVGEEVEVFGEVIDKKEFGMMIKIKAKITNSKNETLMKAELLVKVLQ
jgi:acyl dehydratase